MTDSDSSSPGGPPADDDREAPIQGAAVTAAAGGDPFPPAGDDSDPLGLAGTVINDRYRVIKPVGVGGMGAVYLAEHVAIEKKVALKVLHPEFTGRADARERFLQEARAAARIDHENVVDITDFGTIPAGSVYFAMEHLDGADLAQVNRAQAPLPWLRSKRILLQVCRALAAAHQKGIIHRDMKPGNIFLVEREGQRDFVKVLDFGIAKMTMDDGGKNLTRTGMIFGTPEYMAPEQASGKRPDARVDIYAVGVIMYELLTGQVPFSADTFMGVLTKHMFEPPPPPLEVNPDADIGPEAEAVLARALAKEPETRYQTIGELAADLERIPVTAAAGQSGAAGARLSVPPPTTGAGTLPPLATPGAPRWRMVAAALGLLVTIGGVLAAVAISRDSGTATTPGEVASAATPDSGSEAPGQPASVSAGGSQQAAAATPAPDARVPRTHQLTLKSSPSGAAIYSGTPAPGAEPVGKTPATLELLRQTEELLFTVRLEGYLDQQQRVVPDRDREVLLQLKKRRPARPRAAAGKPRPKPKPRPRPRPKPRPSEDLVDPYAD